MISTKLKDRQNNHSTSLNPKKYENEAEISKYIWKS